MEQYALSVKNISKSYGVVQALQDVSLDIRKGEVHTLLGENGAGKSTLMKIISGECVPDSGVIEIDGKKYASLNSNMARQLGISIVHQELAIFENMYVYENIFPHELPGREKDKIIRQKAIVEEARKCMERFGLDIDPMDKMNDLRLSSQQMVEILRALSDDSHIVLLDEPTSGLNSQETDLLMDTLKKLRDEGYTIIYISHRISEIMQISDRITVMRDGKRIDTIDNHESITENFLVSLMVGRDFSSSKYAKKTSEQLKNLPVLFEVKDLYKKNVIEHVSFQARKGEVLGVFGLEGSGTHELSRMLFGLHGIDSGEIELDGQKIKKIEPIEMIKYGVSYLNNNRKDAGLFFEMSIAENFAAPIVDKLSEHGIWSRKNVIEHARNYTEQFSIVLGSIDDKPASLSGGNQQKVMLSVCLGLNPRLLIINEPTRGIDVGAKMEILKFLSSLAKKDVTILCFSSDLPELITLCDRLMVMNSCRVSGFLEQDEITEENVMRLAALKISSGGGI